MIPAIQEINFPSYATLHQATASFSEMGERTISTQVRIDGDIVPDFNGWELSFKGERFILNTKDPQAVKDNSTRNSLVDLTFVSWPVNELKRYFFFEPTSIDSGTAIADKYIAPVNLPVEDFAVLFNKVLKYYFGDRIVFSLYMSGQGQYSTDRALVEINYTYIWDVLVKFFEIYGVRWRIEYDSTNDVYTIKAGYPANEIGDHDFEYGYKGGLVRFERQVQDVDIHNILLGRGGEKNLPYRYFKRTDPQNPEWTADPDAIPELANIYFERLRDINFRWYVRGWMQNPNRDTSWEEEGYSYPAYTISQDSPYYFAYEKGRTDEKFNPVEYVRDLTSIENYGERWGALDDNDDIFPTIQSVTRDPLGRIDETVAVSDIVTDDISAMAQNAAVEKSINRMVLSLSDKQETEFEIQSEEFTIPSGSTGNITYAPIGTDELYPGLVRFDTDNSTIVAVSGNNEYPIDAIPAGTYRLKLNMVIARSGQATSATGTFGIENIVLTTSSQETDAWKPTFDIWVKNIWGTEKQAGETDVQYAERVWLPILGDRAGNEAKIVFSTGFMSISEDYEFTIVSYPVYDTSKSINGTPSEWRITLRKSDAEFDATGLYIPNASSGGKPVAGDKFFFIGIDMPFRYVTLAEEDVNTNKSAQLDTEAAISPTWIMNLDKVRVHTLEDDEYGQTLAERMSAGTKVWITDPRFTPGKKLQLYIQSITYTWNEPSDESPYIVPDIEVVLSDQVITTESVVQRIQNDVSSIKNQYARISDVEAVVRSVAEPIFLKKTGESDSSDSPTQFSSKVTSKGFRQGGVGGKGWGIYRDNTSDFAEGEEGEGDTVFEADRIVVRKELQVNSLVINQISYLGGMEIISAAKIDVSKVIETENGYVCYFDQRQNSVSNNFVVNDIAMGQVFNPNNTEQRYYKAIVTAVDLDSITLSKTQKVGNGVPKVGDVIVQYGNTTQSGRQYVIIRDVIGGGYERMLSGLNSLSADGDEYYFAGRESSGTGPRWFVGSHEQNGDYAEYENGVLTIKANVVFKQGQVIPGLSDLTDDVEALEYLKTALPKSDTIITGGLILSKVIALRDSKNAIMSGINGDTSLSNIAAWYGGPMADKEASPTPASYAKSLFRFDGSGYLAGGNIHWDNQGYGGIPGITWSNDGTNDVVTIGANVRLASVEGDTVTDLLNAVNSIKDWFEEVNLGTTESPAWALRLKKHGELERAFITYGDQIVGGGTPGSGGGGGGAAWLSELYDVEKNLSPNVGDLLVYASNVALNPDGTIGPGWTTIAQSQLVPDLSDYYTKGQTNSAISAAISALNLGAAATYGIGSVVSGNTGLVTGGAVYSAINEAVSSVLKMQGTTTTAISDGSTTNPVTINGSSYTAKKGDVVMYGNKEFWWTGSAWEELGDEASWALKTTTITAGQGLSGGGTLASNRTISLSQDTLDSLALADTSLQPGDLAGYATQQWVRQQGFITGITETDIETALDYIPIGPDALNGYAKENWVTSQGYLKATVAADTYQTIISDLADIREGANLGSSAYQLPTSGIPKTDLAQEVRDSLVLADSSIQAVYDMTLKVGTTTIGTFRSGAEDQTLTITAQNLYDTIGATKYHPYGGNAAQNTFVIGGATFTWHPASGSTPGYLELNSPFVTQGDQIVGSGTPGSGGGGGAGYLYELKDVADSLATPTSGMVIQYNGTEWIGVAASSIGGVTSVAGNTGAVTAAQIATALTGAGYKLTDTTYTNGTGISLSGTTFSNSGVRSTTINGNYLRVNTNGTNADLTIPYSSGAGCISIFQQINNESSISTSGLYIYQGAGGAWTGAVTSMAYAAILALGGYSRGWQLWAQRGVGSLTWRNGKDDISGWNTERIILDSANYTSYINTTNFPGLNGNQTISLSGDVSGSGATSISVTIGQGKVTNAMLAGSIANGKLANSAITINGSSTSLGGSFNTASITAGTAGQSTASSGVSFSIPYVTMNTYGIVTGYGTHTHTISAQNLYDTIGTTKYAPYDSAGYLPLSGGTITGGTYYPLTIKTSSSVNILRLYAGDILGASFAWQSGTYGAYMMNNAVSGSPYVNIASDGVFKYNNIYTFWHSGNANLSTVPWACSTLTASDHIYMANNKYLYRYDSGGVARSILDYESNGTMLFCWGNATGGYSTSICGNTISLRYGTSHTIGMTMDTSGNVGFGTTTPAYKLDVSGDACFGNTNVQSPILLRRCSDGNVAYSIGSAGTSGNDAVTLQIYNSTGSTCRFTLLNGVAAVDGNTVITSANWSSFIGTSTAPVGYASNVVYSYASITVASAGTYGWYRLIRLPSDPRGNISFMLRTYGGSFAPLATVFDIDISWSRGLNKCSVSGANGVCTSIRLTYDGSYSYLEVYLPSAYVGYASLIKSSVSYSSLNDSAVMYSGSLSAGGGTVAWTRSIYGSCVYAFYGTTYVDGNFLSTGDQVVSSDATLKTNLKDVTYSVADIAKAPAVTFDWKDGRGRSAGSIAQYWKDILPELVHGEEGNMSLAYGQLALVNSILIAKHETEQDKEIARLKNRVAELEKQLRLN